MYVSWKWVGLIALKSSVYDIDFSFGLQVSQHWRLMCIQIIYIRNRFIITIIIQTRLAYFE